MNIKLYNIYGKYNVHSYKSIEHYGLQKYSILLFSNVILCEMYLFKVSESDKSEEASVTIVCLFLFHFFENV